jgi:hypothetical protein
MAKSGKERTSGNNLVCRLSILIPWWNDASSFEDTLISILENRPSDAEILVVHDQRYDDPYCLREEVRFVQCAAQSMLELVNTGFHRSEGDVVHIVQPGVMVRAGWTDSALALFESESIGSVAPCVVDSRGGIESGWRFGSGGNLRRVGKTHGLASCTSPQESAGFYLRQPVLDLGGFDLDTLALSELQLGISLGMLGFESVADGNCQLSRLHPHPENLLNAEVARTLETMFHCGRTIGWPTAISHAITLGGEFCRGRFSNLAARYQAWREHDRTKFSEAIAEVRERMEVRMNSIPFPQVEEESNSFDQWEWDDSEQDGRRAA